jgi:AmiR/NasT family two-component response regulator
MAVLEKSEQNTRVFVVDDDRLILATLTSDLDRAGYTVESFEDGFGALAAYKKSPPDLVLMDIRMPKMDGIETAKAMLEFEYRPILILSAYDDVDTVTSSISSGIAGYLVKPLHPSQLIPSIETSLVRSKDVDKLMKNNKDLVGNTEKNRLISTAVGILMERSNLGREHAFTRLRDAARSQRRTMMDVSQELVEAVSKANETCEKLV